MIPQSPKDALSGLAKKSAKGVRIAGEVDRTHDLTVVSQESQFATAVQEIFKALRPKKLIETGTYLGTGTTATIARSLKALGLLDAEFYSIEVNPRNHHTARANFIQQGIADMVRPLLGLSIPRDLLPTLEQIEEAFVNHIEFDDVFVDHQEQERAWLYFQETDFSALPEDWLGRCLRKFSHRPDFVLLDSGGHLGNLEFNYLIDRLEGPCIIACDDVYHVKHRKSLDQMEKDPRFTILARSKEKFGFAIARFEPGPMKANPTVERLLWVRGDSIGDALLAASMLPHIRARYPDAQISVLCQGPCAAIYESCPHVDNVFTFDRQKASEDTAYREGLQNSLALLGVDLCLHSVFSRDVFGDLWAGSTGALESIAMAGDTSNLTPELKQQTDAIYTKLITSEEGQALELDRHRDFLMGLGIEVAEPLAPMIWINPEDDAFAEAFFKEQTLDPARTLALFAGAQYAVRLYEGYGAALKGPVLEGGFRVIALGAEHERDLNQAQLDLLGSGHLNLCGKLPLRQTAAILRRCRMAVGAETGLAHLACALGIPNVVVLGGGHFARFMPYSPLTMAVSLPLTCYFCNWQCPYASAYCVRDLAPEVLEGALRESLAAPSDRPRLRIQSTWEPPKNGPEILDLGALLNPAIVDAKSLTPPERKASRPVSVQAPMATPEESTEPALTVICAVWHKDSLRHELIRKHQACLNAQTCPVQALYVFDGGDLPPADFDGDYVATRRPLTIYEAWDLAVQNVRTPYVMNLNLDDRLCPDAAEAVIQALDAGADLVGGEWRICFSQAETDATILDERIEDLPVSPQWPPLDRKTVRLGSGTGEQYTYGPATAWRMSLHEKLPHLPWRFEDGTPVRVIGDAIWWELLGHGGKRRVRLPRILGRYHYHPAEQAEFRHSGQDEWNRLKTVRVRLT